MVIPGSVESLLIQLPGVVFITKFQRIKLETQQHGLVACAWAMMPELSRSPMNE